MPTFGVHTKQKLQEIFIKASFEENLHGLEKVYDKEWTVVHIYTLHESFLPLKLPLIWWREFCCGDVLDSSRVEDDRLYQHSSLSPSSPQTHPLHPLPPHSPLPDAWALILLLEERPRLSGAMTHLQPAGMDSTLFVCSGKINHTQQEWFTKGYTNHIQVVYTDTQG